MYSLWTRGFARGRGRCRVLYFPPSEVEVVMPLRHVIGGDTFLVPQAPTYHASPHRVFILPRCPRFSLASTLSTL